MRSNALKIDEEIRDPMEFSEEMWDMRRRRIAEAAADAPASGPELEEFVLKYNMKISGFA